MAQFGQFDVTVPGAKRAVLVGAWWRKSYVA